MKLRDFAAVAFCLGGGRRVCIVDDTDDTMGL